MIRYGRSLALLIFFALCTIGARASEAGACVPNEVVLSYLKSHPDWSIVDLANLSSDDRQLWIQHHPGLCPGMASGKLDSSARTWYALAMLKRANDKVYEKVVLLTESNRGVTSRILSVPQDVTSPFVVWRIGPGTFLDYHTGKEVTIKFDSFVYEKLESASVQYYLRGGHIRKLVASY